jgi:hypothetical protein
VVELVDAVPKRGALEKIYGLDSDVWNQLSARPELEGGFDCFPVEVDSTAWNEICTARNEFEERVAAVVQASVNQPTDEVMTEVRRIIVGVGAFLTPPSSTARCSSEDKQLPVG